MKAKPSVSRGLTAALEPKPADQPAG
jgi:hypothetical protein